MASDPVFHPLVGTLPLEDGSIDVVLSSLEWVRTFSNFDKNRNEKLLKIGKELTFMDVNEFFELINSEPREQVLKYMKSIPEHLKDVFAEALFDEVFLYIIEEKYEKVIQYLEIAKKIVINRELKLAIIERISICYINWGNSLANLSEIESDISEKKRLLQEGCNKYEKAIQIDPKLSVAYSACGKGLSDLSELEHNLSEKRRLLKESCSKHEQAVQINPDLAIAYYNWGNSLANLSEIESDISEKKRLLQESCTRYKSATEVNPNYAEAYSNWGANLFDLSELEHNLSEKRRLLQESCSKHEQAVQINPIFAEAYYNWGIVLYHLSELEHNLSEKRRLLKESCSKHEQAVQINPDLAIAYYNWGNSLANLSGIESDISEKKRLLQEGCGKYNKAVQINPDFTEVYFNWGNSLTELFGLEHNLSEKRRLLKESCSIHEMVVDVNPNLAEAYYNWGTVLYHLSELEHNLSEKKRLLKKSCTRYERAVEINSNYAEVYSNWGVCLATLSLIESNLSEKKRLIRESCTRYERAVEINSNYARAYFNWGNRLFYLSELEHNLSEKRRLLKESCTRYEKAVEINPDYAKTFASHGLVLLFSNTELDTAEKLFNKASIKFHGKEAKRMKAFVEWTKARRHMNKRKWQKFRERMQEAKRIFEEIHDPLTESVLAVINFSYVDEQLEVVLRESSAIQALAGILEILRNLPEFDNVTEPERRIYSSRLASFEVLGGFIDMIMNIDDSTNLFQLEQNVKELLKISRRIEEICDSINFLPGKRVIVNISTIIEDESSTLIECLRNTPEKFRRSLVSSKLETFWRRISPAIPLLNGDYSLESENITILKYLHSLENKFDEIETKLERIENIIIKKNVVKAEYIFEISEPLILKAFLPFSQKLRFVVKIGELSDIEIERTLDNVRKLNSKGKKIIIMRLSKLKGIDKILLEKLKTIR
ncbi:MAG: hypothetical protein PVG65_01775 [Candidatus Thorarchaeota archaeon]